MHPSLDLLEQAISLAHEESLLLDQEDVEDLEERAGQRQDLVQRAWKGRDGCDPTLLRTALERLHALQKDLSDTASRRLEEDRELLSRYRKTTKVVTGYGNTRGRRSAARVFNKSS